MSVDVKSSYYDAGGIELLSVIKAKLSPEQYRGYLHGNILKYSGRMNFKGSYDRDLEKVGVYQGLLSELSPLGREDVNLKDLSLHESRRTPEGALERRHELGLYPVCEKCMASEVPHNGPRTQYQCGSNDFDGQDFVQSDYCSEVTEAPVEATAEHWRKKFLKQQEEVILLKKTLDERCSEIYDLGKKLAEQ